MQTNIVARPLSAPTNGHTQVAQPQRPSRMTLGAVTRGRIARPFTVLLCGTEGIGKTTWAASSDQPIVLPGEEGTHHLDVARFPRPESWADVFEAIRVLRTEPHEYHTFVVDTVDALEPLCWAHVCAASGKTAIEDVGGGYGKGYTAALAEWHRYLAALEALRREKSMAIINIAHVAIRTFKNPAGPDYDRFGLKINDKAAGLLREWHDCVLFARYEEYVREVGNKGKASSTGARVVHTARTAAWDGKNRYNLPETLPLNWEDFARAVAAGRPAEPERLRTEIADLVAQLADAPLAVFDRATFEKCLADAGADAVKLSFLKDRLSAKLAHKEA